MLSSIFSGCIGFWEVVWDLKCLSLKVNIGISRSWGIKVIVGLPCRSKEWKTAWSSGAQMWGAWRCWWSTKLMTSWHRGPCTTPGRVISTATDASSTQTTDSVLNYIEGGWVGRGESSFLSLFKGVSGLLLCNPLVLGVKISLCANISGTDMRAPILLS